VPKARERVGEGGCVGGWPERAGRIGASKNTAAGAGCAPGWSSLEYYRLPNAEVRARLGGLHSADCMGSRHHRREIQRFMFVVSDADRGLGWAWCSAVSGVV
jgi:hypothetical protein